MRNMKFWLLRLTLLATTSALGSEILVEAEAFKELGGWVIDQQSMDAMGSPYLLAHGLGRPVADATTTLRIPAGGVYRVWVRTRDWVAPWQKSGAPGRFQLLVNGKPLKTTFGIEGAEWQWQDGGTLEVPPGVVALSLHDLTGFNGRCDAVLLTSNLDFTPPDQPAELEKFRRDKLGVASAPHDGGEFDLVVVGGGVAGCCAAIGAARLGCRVVLVQDRFLLGGNNSSETRVGLSGLIHQEPYPRLGDLVDEIGPVGHWNLYDARRKPELPRSKEVLAIIEAHPEKKQHNAGPPSNYEDELKLRIARQEPNLHLVLGTRVVKTIKQGNRITTVIGRDIVSGVDTAFRGRFFADCTGDGCVGFQAGADFRVGREARSETGESLAPEQADNLMMGVSVQWYAVEELKPSNFPECPWAIPFTEDTALMNERGDWDWEAGFYLDSARDIEKIRDIGLMAAFGNWSFVKNHSSKRAEFANKRLEWVAYIGGKRESRRLMGDIILTEQDILEQKAYPDASVTTTWPLDLHYPHPENSRLFPGLEFRSIARGPKIKPYAFPYRCLYSRNIENLLMAGRDISVTHVALGSVRVMRTCGMMGEVVGMAASLCTRHNTTPRGVYEQHLAELQDLMRRGVGGNSLVKE